jgi:two-component system C4-dicarboxylate transport sensor histidine kinase DctB
MVMLASGLAAFALSERRGVEALRADADYRLDLFAASLDSLVNLYVHVPNSIELSPEVRLLLDAPADAQRQEAASRYLERLNIYVASDGILILDTVGSVVAASNWSRPGSLLGQNMSAAPFFRTARSGETGRHYAAGVGGNLPGYLVSQPIWGEGRRAGEVIGVAAIRVSLGALEEAWLPAGIPALIADEGGIVVVTSIPEWRSLRLASPSGAAKTPTAADGSSAIRDFPVRIDQRAYETGQSVEFSQPPSSSPDRPQRSHEFLARAKPLATAGWTLVTFSDLAPIRRQAGSHAALAASAAGFLLLFLLYIGQRRRNLAQRLETQKLLERANTELEEKVRDRTADLTTINERLRAEVAERERAENTLRNAQSERIHAAKMAVLGQLATGISHELAQPLGALRTLSANAAEFMRRGDLTTAQSNLALLGKLVDQMGAILGPLKNFARKSPQRLSAVVIEHAVGNALFLLDQRLRIHHIELEDQTRGSGITGWCDQNRLEQALVNLIGNAVDAMREAATRRLSITVERRNDGGCRIAIADSGPGIDEAAQPHLFEAFFTTKSVGEGLGLGLIISRDIVREFGGDIRAENGPDGGAVFFVDLPAVPPSAPENT